MAKSSGEIAVELQAKFEFYLLGLTFTLLALSIQTAKFGLDAVTDVFELVGWLCLLASGLLGILRGEWVPVLYQIFDKQHWVERRRDQVAEALGHGVSLPVTFEQNGAKEVVAGQAAITKFDDLLVRLAQQQKTAEERLRGRYRWLKGTLFAGIVALVVARGFIPAKAAVMPFWAWALEALS